MIKYAVLLTDSIMAVMPTNQPLPDEFLLHLDAVKVFSQWDDALAYLAANLTFDDMWEFCAPEGIVAGVVYHRNNIDRDLSQ